MSTDLSNMNLEERTKYLELKAKYKDKLKPWYQKWWGIIILIILFLVLLITTISLLYIRDKVAEIKAENEYNQSVNNDKSLEFAIYGPGTNYYLGANNAPLTIVEFSDFACPYCKEAHTTLKNIINRYPGKVKIVFRDMPLHENSVDLALAARCAGEQGLFWPAHDLIFANQDSLKATGSELQLTLSNLITSLGAQRENFDTCVSEKRYVNNIAVDYQAGNDLKLKGTPTWFLNGRILSGYLPEQDYFTLLDNYFSTK